MDMGQDVSFSDFLNKMQMDEKTYILELRSRLQKHTILLKWNPIDIHINSYGKFVDKFW
jgi:hypothetical protein